MKPTRIRMCHSLVMNYGLYKKMEIFVGVALAVIGSESYAEAIPHVAREAGHETRNVPVPH
jgi:hypothetical protein